MYISVGDHLNGADAQLLSTFHGKILRVNKDGTVPTDNPFFDGAGPNKDAIWARGLRNPFRMSFDAVTGRLYIGDVGGNDHSVAMEEVNIGTPGANYGWPMCEGSCGVSGTTGPLYSYAHANRDAAITGGFVYRGTQFPTEYRGSYFFGDYAQNTLSRLRLGSNGEVLGASNFWPANVARRHSIVGDVVDLVEGPDGSLYYIDIGFTESHDPNGSAIRRIRYTIGNQPPTAVASASPTSGQPPLTVQFSSAGSIDPEGSALSYSWTFGDGTTSTAANPSHTYTASGGYTSQAVRLRRRQQHALGRRSRLRSGVRPFPSSQRQHRARRSAPATSLASRVTRRTPRTEPCLRALLLDVPLPSRLPRAPCRKDVGNEDRPVPDPVERPRLPRLDEL